jgi:uncharacterized membrane-anchored protein
MKAISQVEGEQVMAQEETVDYKSANVELEAQLTKRNQQYVFDLKKSLIAANFSDKDIQSGLHGMLETLVKEQKSGTTARQLFGTVSECTETFLAKPEKPQITSKPWQMWLDNFMMLFGLLYLVTSAMGVWMSISKTSKGQAAVYGITTLLLASAVGGLVFYLMYHLIYRYEYPGADKSKKPKMWKTAIILVLATIVWLAAFQGSILLPSAINPVLDPVVGVIISILVLLLRWYLKRRYGIVGSLSVPRQPRQQQPQKRK